MVVTYDHALTLYKERYSCPYALVQRPRLTSQRHFDDLVHFPHFLPLVISVSPYFRCKSDNIFYSLLLGCCYVYCTKINKPYSKGNVRVTISSVKV